VEGNMLAMLSSRHRIAPLAVSIEENFGWWRPDCIVFDFKMVEQDSRLLSARKALMDYLTGTHEYRLRDEQDGVVLLALVEPSPGGHARSTTQP